LQAAQGATKPRGKAGAVHASSAAEGSDEEEDSGGVGHTTAGDAEELFDWQAYRRDCVALLIKAVNVDFRRLWSMGLPEEVRHRPATLSRI